MKIARKKFQQQRETRLASPGFELSFEEWWDIWQKSGHWEERGKCKGQYVMSRIGDQGPYKVGNVFIQTNAQNIKDAWLGKKRGPASEEHKIKNAQAQLGKKNSPGTIAKRVATYKASIQRKKAAINQLA
jgi:hypothetical protein